MKVYLEEIKGLAIGRSITLPKGTTKIGRKDLDINIANPRISQNHAEIHFSGTRVFVLDRNSTNGTFVNWKRVERMALRDGDLIALGGDSEDAAAAIFKIHIISMFSKQRVVIIVKKAGKVNRLFVAFLIIALLGFMLWLFFPVQETSVIGNSITKLKDINRPWIGAEPLLVSPLLGGTAMLCALGDEILLPDERTWNVEVNYEETSESDPFDKLMYITVINPGVVDDGNTGSQEQVVSTISVQRFKQNFSSNIEPYIENNFKWHESEFLKDNNIDNQNLNYSSTELCIWQWLIWEKETKFNLYASCITKRGRILLQASSFDSYFLKRFFQYVAGSYKEGQE